MLVLVGLWAQLLRADFTMTNQFGSGLSQGVAWGDYNGDGRPDLLVARRGRSCLYRNDGNNVFTPVDSSFQTVNPYGVAWADYDNDGRLDFAVGDFAGVLVCKNTESGFKLNDLAGGPVRALAWGDYNNDGFLDLAVGNYGEQNQLFRNDGAGNFIAVPNALGSAYDSTNALFWIDYDNDGWSDLVMVNYAGVVRLFRNNQNGGFVESLPPFDPTAHDGMGGAAGDYDNDGWLDLLVTGFGDSNHLYRNEAGSMTEIPGVFGGPEYCSGCAWGDFNNDGYLDFVTANLGSHLKLYTNGGNGAFAPGAFFGLPDSSYAVAAADCDRDGDLDLAVANHGSNRLYLNKTNATQFITVRLVGRGGGYTNRSGIGARVYLYKPDSSLAGLREINGGSGYSSMNDLEAQFGSPAGRYDLVVRWPASGFVDRVDSVPADTALIIVEDQTSPLNPDSVRSPTHVLETWTNRQSITMVWSPATDPLGSGIKGYACGFDTLANGVPPDTINVRFPDTVFSTTVPYDSDKWFFHIRAMDNVGNWARGIGTTGPYKIDHTPPQTPVLIFPAQGEKINRTNPVLKWHPALDLSGIGSYLIKVASDSSFDPSYLDFDSTTHADTTVRPSLSPGQHYWQVQAFDKLDNPSLWSQTNSFTVDTVPPSVLVTLPQNGDTGVGLQTNIIVTFKENDIDSTTVNANTFTITGNITGSYPGKPYFLGGNYVFRPLRNFRSHEKITCVLTTGIRDSAGNRLATNFSWAFTTGGSTGDTIPPVASDVSAHPDTTYGASFFLLEAKISDVGKGGSGILQAEYFMDIIGQDGFGKEMTGNWGNPEIIVSDTVFTALIDTGFHTFYVHGMDAASNWGKQYDSVVVWVTNLPPVPHLTIKTDRDTISIGDSLTIGVSSTKPLQYFELAVWTPGGVKIHPDLVQSDSLHYRASYRAVGIEPGHLTITANGADFSGNQAGDTAQVIVKNPDHLLPREQVFCWPNPVTSEIGHFHYFVTATSDIRLRIYKLTGEQVLTRTQFDAVGGSSGNNFTVNLSGFSNDMYLFKIEANNADGSKNESVVKKFAVAR